MFVSPMLLERIEEPVDSEKYVIELKLDGIRLLLTKFNNILRLYTRHNNEVTSMFNELFEELVIPDGTILDGELIVPGPNGHPNFEAMMERFKSKKSNHPIQFCVFDIIYFSGKNISSLPLLERKMLLNKITYTDKVVPVQWNIGNGLSYFNAVKDFDLEGIVQKRIDSKYHINKRSSDWLKVINYKYINVIVSGFIKENKSFLLQSLEGQPLGVMEFVPVEARKIIHSKTKESISSEDNQLILFDKGIECNVKFRNWTSNGKLRIPSFNKFVS